jgi:hypothetical protein
MGILANHVPSIEQLKPGLVEIIEESGGSKQFFRASTPTPPLQKHVCDGGHPTLNRLWDNDGLETC